MIINIWSKQHLLRDHFKSLEQVNAIFPGDIFVWKPVTIPTGGMYCYFELQNNSDKIWDDSNGTMYKEWLFEFYICSNKKDTPDVSVFECLDTLSNAIITQPGQNMINLDWFKVLSISEWPQSWILRDLETPYLIAQYKVVYKYLY